MSDQENGIVNEECGEENEEDVVDPKEKPKMIRILTVVAYTLSVSMAAILLSVYYIFMWEGHPTLARKGPVANLLRVDANEMIKYSNALEHPDVQANVKQVILERSIDNLLGPNVESTAKKENSLVYLPYEPTAIPVVEATTSTVTETAERFDDQDQTWPEYTGNFTSKLNPESLLIKKLI